MAESVRSARLRVANGTGLGHHGDLHGLLGRDKSELPRRQLHALKVRNVRLHW